MLTSGSLPLVLPSTVPLEFSNTTSSFSLFKHSLSHVTEQGTVETTPQLVSPKSFSHNCRHQPVGCGGGPSVPGQQQVKVRANPGK
jgi:hypothetical protein